MRLFVAMLALGLSAGVASASQLDYQPGLIGGPAQYNDLSSHQTLMENSNPVRHRRPWRTRVRVARRPAAP